MTRVTPFSIHKAKNTHRHPIARVVGLFLVFGLINNAIAIAARLCTSTSKALMLNVRADL